MRKMTALFVSMAFIFSTTGLAVAQTSTPAPAATDKKTDDKSMDKKPAAKKMTMEEKKAACLEKAGTDEAKKTKCEKAAKNSGKKPAASAQAQAPAAGAKKQ